MSMSLIGGSCPCDNEQRIGIDSASGPGCLSDSSETMPDYAGFGLLISKMKEIKFDSVFGIHFVKATYSSGKIEHILVNGSLEHSALDPCVGGASARRVLLPAEVLLCFQQLDVNNCLLAEADYPSCLDRAFRSHRRMRDWSLCGNCDSLKSLLFEMHRPDRTRRGPFHQKPGLFIKRLPNTNARYTFS